MTQVPQFQSKTEKKIKNLLPCNYRSLTEFKDKQEGPPINAEILTVCRNKMGGCKVVITPESFRDQVLELIE